MKSLEMKNEPMLDMPMQSSYPMMHVSGEQMPEINDWQIGKEYTITVKVRMKEYETEVTMDNMSSHACLDVLAYEA